MAGVTQGSTLYGGSVSKAAIYEIAKGLGFTWGNHIKTELNVDAKPRQLTVAEHAGNPIRENVSNPRRPTDFPSTDTLVINGRLLNVVPLMVPETMTSTDFLDTFPRFQPSGNSIDLKNNPEITKVVFSLLMEAAKTQINDLHSAGDDSLLDPSPLRFYDGFVKQIIADVEAIPASVPAILTPANIVDKIFELRDAIDPRLRTKPNLKMFMSWADFDLADRAFRETQNSVAINTLNGQSSITQSDGSKINFVPIIGIPKDFVFATIADNTDNSNLVQGVWMDNDTDMLKMYKEVEADQTYNLLMRMYLGVNYKTGKNIWYLNNV